MATAADPQGSADREVGFDVVGSDPLADLAVVRTQGATPPPATVGDADSLPITVLRSGAMVDVIAAPTELTGS